MIPNGPIVNHHYTITADINLPIEPVAFVLAVLFFEEKLLKKSSTK